MSKMRVLAFLSMYPTLSQTYKENELRALLPHCELRILAGGKVDAAYHDHLPCARYTSPADLRRVIDEFKPDIVHGHYINTTRNLAQAAEMAGVPYTVRTHSFDLIDKPPEALRPHVPFVNRDSCIGVLAFPFLVPKLAEAGFDEAKLYESWPVVDYARFYDRSPNGPDVMNTGACLPKKNMESYIELATRVTNRRFDLYPIGYLTDQIREHNEARGSPVHVHPMIEPDLMPAVYKRHQWLIYTANPEVPTIGWPMSIAEAQASGTGVLIQRIRPDVEIYVGDAGYVFDTLEEAADILRQDVPEEIRERGFEHARKSDIYAHIELLLNIWRKALGREDEMTDRYLPHGERELAHA
ncbi:MAG: glycosyltransferase [Sphingomonadaceae bacterium]